jgi:hypothetical protein
MYLNRAAALLVLQLIRLHLRLFFVKKIREAGPPASHEGETWEYSYVMLFTTCVPRRAWCFGCHNAMIFRDKMENDSRWCGKTAEADRHM